MTISKKFLSIPSYIFLSTTLIYAQSSKSKAIDLYMQRAFRLGIFSGNIRITDGNTVIYNRSLGFTDASKTKALTGAYRFHIGSIAKEFGAVGIMMLKEQGKLNLEDKVSKYISDLPGWANEISIRNLLAYTSGLPDLKWKTVKGDADNWTDLKSLGRLDNVPGAVYAYNNNNNFLQKAIIAKISGMTFNEFVQQHMLIPCGMTASLTDPTDLDPMVAKSYNNDGRQDELFYPISGWVAVTADDFSKWSAALADFKLISPESTREILYPGGADRQAGLGKGSMAGNKMITHVHDGMAMNYQALLDADLSKGRTVILLSNNKQNNVYALNDALQAILDGKPYMQPVKSFVQHFKKQLQEKNAKELLALYRTLRKQNGNDYGFNSESALNETGYYLMEINRLDEALVTFRYNAELFPKEGNVYDSLGEVYYKLGDKKNALLNYRKAVQLSPDNSSARSIILELSK